MQNSSDRIKERLNRLAETDISPLSDIQMLRLLLDFSESITLSTLKRFTPPKGTFIDQRQESDQLLQIHAIVGCDIGLLVQTITPHPGDNIFILAPSIGAALLMLDNFDLASFYAPTQVHLFLDSDKFISSLKKEQNFWKKVNLWLTPLARKEQPELCSKITELIKICNKVAESEISTLNYHYFNLAYNENKNLIKLINRPHANTVNKKILTGVPVLLIGAGPSLKASLPLLRRFKQNNQTLIIAASTVLRVLEKEGVIPHFTIIIESRQQKHFSTLSKSYINKLTLLAALQTNPEHLKYTFKDIYWFHHQTSAVASLVNQLIPEAIPIRSSGNVINDGLRQALSWGCAPIALCGCDMAYTPKQKYLSGLEKNDDSEEAKKEYFPVPGQKGETLYAPAEFIAYAQVLQEIVANELTIEGKKQEIYNLSTGGRRLTGTIEASPEEFYMLTSNKKPDINQKVQELINSWTTPSKNNLGALKKHYNLVLELHKTLELLQKDKDNLTPITEAAYLNICRHLLDQLPEFCNGAAQIMIPWMWRLHSGGTKIADLKQLQTIVNQLLLASKTITNSQNNLHY